MTDLDNRKEKSMLECNAQNFWAVSKFWNSEEGEAITFIEAAKKLNHIIASTNPIKPIVIKAKALLHDIIHNSEEPND